MNVLQENRNEILWNLINSALAGGLVFFGACSTGDITTQGIISAFFASGIVMITKFKDYWSKEEKEYKNKIFTFL